VTEHSGMSNIERKYVIRRCPECHGQAGDTSVTHLTDCPLLWRIFVPEEAEVAWPDATQGAVDAYLSELVAESRTICEREGVPNLAEWIGKTVLARVTGEGQ
jgi:hypothetical protein